MAANSMTADMQLHALQRNDPNHEEFNWAEIRTTHDAKCNASSNMFILNSCNAATDIQSQSAQSCESEHLPGGCIRAAAAVQLRFASAMQTCTQDATPEPAKQTGRQRAPGKVQLRLDLIQRVPCYAAKPTWISRQNHTGLQGQPPYQARC